MAEKSIWKKTLGFFVEVKDEQAKPVKGSENMQAVMAETRKSMKAMQDPAAPAPSPIKKASPQPQLSRVVNHFIPKDAVKEVPASQSGLDEAADFEALGLRVCNRVLPVFKLEEILKPPERLRREQNAADDAANLTLGGNLLCGQAAH